MRDIIASAVEVLNARPNATMAELAEAAGISRATLHRRFPTRDDLLSRIAEEAATAARHAVARARPGEGPAAQACTRLIEALVPLGARFAFLLREGSWLDELPAVAPGVTAVTEAVDDAIRRGRRGGQFRVDLPASFQARLVRAAIFSAWEAIAAGELGHKEAPAAAATALLAGIGAGHD